MNSGEAGIQSVSSRFVLRDFIEPMESTVEIDVCEPGRKGPIPVRVSLSTGCSSSCVPSPMIADMGRSPRARFTSPPGDDPFADGPLRFGHARLFRWRVRLWACLAVGLLVFVPIRVPIKERWDPYLLVLIELMLIACAAYLFGCARQLGEVYELSREGIKHTAANGREVSLSWEAVGGVHTSTFFARTRIKNRRDEIVMTVNHNLTDGWRMLSIVNRLARGRLDTCPGTLRLPTKPAR